MLIVNIDYKMESSLTQEQMLGGEVDSGCLELCGSLLHPWTWILGWLIFLLVFVPFSSIEIGILVAPYFVFVVHQSFKTLIPHSQVGFIPCNVSNIMEPYTFTVVNGLAGRCVLHSYKFHGN